MRFSPWLIALLLTASQDPVDPPRILTFVPPKDAKRGDVEKAAKVIEKRSSDFGYKGVTAKVVGSQEAPEIEITCATGVTPAMEPHLVKLSTKLSRLELRFKPSLTAREHEQFEPGKTSPKDCEWVKDARTDVERWHLFWSTPKADLLGSIKWIDRADNWDSEQVDGYHGPHENYLEFDQKLSEWLLKLPASQLEGACLLVDGIVAHEGTPTIFRPKGTVKRTRWEMAWMIEQNPTFGVRVNNPLPFPLEQKKP